MTTTSDQPTHKLYSVATLKNGERSWTEIGVACPHNDRNGFAFTLSAIPAPGGEFVMRRSFSWKRTNGCWQLITGDDRIIAYIERGEHRWHCFTTEDIGDDGFIGHAPSLAKAKANLVHRFAVAIECAAGLAA